MASTADPPDVGKLRYEQALARYVAARDRGDAAGMREAWDEVCTLFFERVQQAARARARRVLWTDDECDDAESRALTRFATKLLWSFKGTTIGELVMATHQLVAYACADVQRTAAERSRRERSFDAGYGEDDTEPYGDVVRKQHDEALALADDEESEAAFYADGRDLLDWAIPQLGEKQGLVLDMDRRGATTEEIQEALGGASRDVVYQTRRRALKELDKLKEQYPS